MAVVAKRESIFEIAENPADVPDYFGKRGSPVVVNASTVGGYENRLFGSEGLDFAEIFRADEMTVPSLTTAFSGSRDLARDTFSSVDSLCNDSPDSANQEETLL